MSNIVPDLLGRDIGERYEPNYAYTRLLQLFSELAVSSTTYAERTPQQAPESLRSIQHLAERAIGHLQIMSNAIQTELEQRDV